MGGGGKAQQRDYNAEIFVETVNLPASPIMEFTITAQSQCWDIAEDFSIPPSWGDYFLTNAYNSQTYVPTSNNLGRQSIGFEFVTTAHPNAPTIAYGLYKFTNSITNHYFYLDYRDARVGFYSVPAGGDNIDITILYDANTNTFSIDDGIPTPGSFQSISNGDVLKMWELKDQGVPRTYLFPSFWSNSLAVVNNGNGNPKLVWSAYPSSNLVVKKYRVYRAVTQNTYPPPTPNFSLLKDNISPSTFEYTDLNYALGGNLRLYYKITAMVEDPELEIITETSASNIKEVAGGFYKTGDASKITETIHFLNNYPNPFNPQTNISFYLTKTTYVILNVYDVLGNLVSKLIDENKSEGIHQVTFEGSSLSSGVYLLVMMAEGKVISKKMLLSK